VFSEGILAESACVDSPRTTRATSLVYHPATGRAPLLIGWIGVLAVINGALVPMVMGARMLYGMIRRRWLPAALGRVHPRTRTPVIATAVVTGPVLGLALWVRGGKNAQFAKSSRYPGAAKSSRARRGCGGAEKVDGG